MGSFHFSVSSVSDIFRKKKYLVKSNLCESENYPVGPSTIPIMKNKVGDGLSLT